MSLLSKEEWEQIYQEINEGMNTYQNNIYSLISIYSRIKSILLLHGATLDDQSKALSNYPIIIDNLLKGLEATIKEYVGNFNNIAQAINQKGVEVTPEDGYGSYANKILQIPSSADPGATGLGFINSNCFPYSSVTVPEGVTKLSRYWTYYPNLITELTLPQTLATIDDKACWNDSNPSSSRGLNITSLTIPANVDKIGEQSFREVKNLTNLKIQCAKKELTIYQYAFALNNQLTTLTFDSVLDKLILGRGIFWNSKITSIDTTKIKSISYPEGYYNTAEDNYLMGIFVNVPLDNETVNNLIPLIDLNQAYISRYIFAGNKAVTDVTLNIRNPGMGMFNQCTNLKHALIMKTLKVFDGSCFQDSGITIDKIDWEDGTSCSFSGRYIGTSPVTGSSTSSGSMFSHEYYGAYNYNKTSTWEQTYFKIYNIPSTYDNHYSDDRGCLANLPGYDIIYKLPVCSNTALKNFLSHFTDGRFCGLMNQGIFEPNVKIPFSSTMLWSGLDYKDRWTSNLKSITFENVLQVADTQVGKVSLGWLIFANGFNNVEKIKWIRTDNATLNSGCLGEQATSYNDPNEADSFKSLKEIYFGDGAITIEPSLFLSSYLTTNNNYKPLFKRRFPKLKTIRLPGTIQTGTYNCLTAKTNGGQSLFSAHPLFNGIAQTDACPLLTQVVLGEGWQLSIELISICYGDSTSNPNNGYYNLNLDPECMIVNINNLKDNSAEETSSSLIVTDITNTKLQNYCTAKAGQEVTLLAGTESETTMTVPTYTALLQMLETKNWTLELMTGAVARENDYDEYYPKGE